MISESPRARLAEFGISPRKSRGQNFLIDENIARRIASSLDPAARSVFEIGPGLGMLTQFLTGRAVVAVEVEPSLARDLAERLPGVTVKESDALKLDWRETLADTKEPRSLAGNLPFSIAGRLIERACQHADLFREAIFCVQTEVAERLVSPGGRSMGSLTVLAEKFFSARRILFGIPASAFRPRPKVRSSIVKLTFRPGVVWTESDRTLPRRLFMYRRKKLSRALSAAAVPEIWRDKRIDQLTAAEALLLMEMIHKI